jgi:hypothetical protein
MDLTGLGSVFDFGSKVLDKLFPDPAQRDEAKLKLYEAQAAGELKELELVFENAKAQIEVNKLDAQSEKFLQYGWRPFIGWICGAALGYEFLVRPLLPWIFGLLASEALPPLPSLEMGDLMTILMGVLGLGGMRTLEKRARMQVAQ